ncbi:putative lipid II flippase FtsW [Desulfurispira natronophila]|uniref:Probable peptidoglycan glycosyltransferase FtsW n=1 Tax=Desulfurispira natronophila TaxID=682562 RepID=A0A7W7Y513_9BACT|nr:cell division protein FtsW [Desulfurispira natronophila]
MSTLAATSTGRSFRTSHRLLLLTGILCFVGIVFIYSASSITSADIYGNPAHYLQRQIIWLLIGSLVLFIAATIPLAQVRALTFPAIIAIMVLLCLVFLQDPINGAYRWIRIGPFSIQPSEFAKAALIFYAAHKYAQCGERGEPARNALLTVFIVLMVTVLLIFIEPDRGTPAIIVVVLYALSLLAGIRKRSMVLLLLLVVPYLYYDLFISDGYHLNRIRAFLNPLEDPLGKGYQAMQASIAIGSGGLTGVGLGEGAQKIFYLPESHTDFIFAVICEELGLLGGMAVVLLYTALILTIIKVGYEARSHYETYLVFGISYLITVQVFFNLGVAVGALPTKGLALPLISYGGSSLITTLLMLGLVINVARNTERQEQP